MMQELQKLYADIPVPPNLKEDILTYCRTAQEKPKPFIVRYAKPLAALAACAAVLIVSLAATGNLFGDSRLRYSRKRVHHAGNDDDNDRVRFDDYAKMRRNHHDRPL